MKLFFCLFIVLIDMLIMYSHAAVASTSTSAEGLCSPVATVIVDLGLMDKGGFLLAADSQSDRIFKISTRLNRVVKIYRGQDVNLSMSVSSYGNRVYVLQGSEDKNNLLLLDPNMDEFHSIADLGPGHLFRLAVDSKLGRAYLDWNSPQRISVLELTDLRNNQETLTRDYAFDVVNGDVSKAYGTSQNGVTTIDLKSGSAQLFSTLPRTEVGTTSAVALSQDGKTIAGLVNNLHEKGTVNIFGSQGTGPIASILVDSSPTSAIFSKSGKSLFVFTSSDTGRSTIFTIDVPSKEVAGTLRLEGLAGKSILSRDGRYLYVMEYDRSHDTSATSETSKLITISVVTKRIVSELELSSASKGPTSAHCY